MSCSLIYFLTNWLPYLASIEMWLGSSLLWCMTAPCSSWYLHKALKGCTSTYSKQYEDRHIVYHTFTLMFEQTTKTTFLIVGSGMGIFLFTYVNNGRVSLQPGQGMCHTLQRREAVFGWLRANHVLTLGIHTQLYLDRNHQHHSQYQSCILLERREREREMREREQ